MAWKKINDLNWQYDNDPPNPGGALTTLWETGTSGIRTNQSGDELYTNCRIVGSNMDSVPSELNKTYWDGKSLKLYNEVLELDPIVSSQAPASTRPVQQGQVCEFDGVDDYVELPAQVLSLNQAWSIEVDFKYLATPTYRTLYGEGNSATGTPHINLGISGTHSRLYFYWRSDNNTIIINEALFPVYSGNRHTVKVAFDGVDKVTVWKDGVYTDTFTVTPLATTVDRTTIGALGRNNEVSFANAQISHVKTTQSGSTVAQYNLNHASGTTAYDSSGNGNDGTLQNGAAFVVDNTLPPEADKLNLEGYGASNIITKTGSTAWTDGPYSVESSTGDFIMSTRSVSTGSNNKFMFGCNSDPTTSGGFATLDYAIYLTGSAVQVWEAGTSRGAFGNHTFGDLFEIRRAGSTVSYWKNGVLFYTSSTTTSAEMWIDTAGNNNGSMLGHLAINGAYVNLVGATGYDVENAYIPRDESDPTNDIFGNPLQYSGSVYPRRPEYRNSYAASFDGSNDRLECSTNALVRRGNVVEFKVKVDYQANQTTSIIASNHSSNSSTCFSPHMRLVHNSNQIIFYGCRGAPYPYWSIDSSFYGVWHTIKLRMHNTNGTFIYLSIDGGDEVRIDAGITTSPGDWGGTRDTYWAFGTGKNMELSDVKIFTTESDYNSNNPIIHHPLTEGAGDTVYDVSGNGNHGTINDASTATEGAGFWAGRIDGEANALNNNNGFSKRMFFDGVDDEVELNVSPNELVETGVFDMSVEIVWDSSKIASYGRFLWFMTAGGFFRLQRDSNTSTFRLWARQGAGLDIIPKTGFVISADTNHVIRLVGNGVNCMIYLDGSLINTVTMNTANFYTPTWSKVSLGEASSSQFKGTIYNWSLITASITQQLNGYGNTDADWTDQSGNGNDGTVNGSPALLRIPADTSEPTKDVFGDTLTNPAITDGYNGAETELDAYNIAEGNNPSPATSGHSALDAIESGTEFTSDDSVYNRITSAAEDDRLITFTEDLTGDDKTLAEKYTQNP